MFYDLSVVAKKVHQRWSNMHKAKEGPGHDTISTSQKSLGTLKTKSTCKHPNNSSESPCLHLESQQLHLDILHIPHTNISLFHFHLFPSFPGVQSRLQPRCGIDWLITVWYAVTATSVVDSKLSRSPVSETGTAKLKRAITFTWTARSGVEGTVNSTWFRVVGKKQSVTFWQRDMFRLLKERDKNSATAGHLPRIKYLQKIAGRTNPNLCKPVQFDTILPLLCNWKGRSGLLLDSQQGALMS